MNIVEVSTGNIYPIEVLPVENTDYKLLTKSRYFFQNHFTNFLETYIDAIYSQRSKFAKDINITPVFLSQVIKNHREPNEEFILKLMIHSEKAFKNVGDFHKEIWYQVYFQEKIGDTMSRQEQWRPEIEKQVKLSEFIEE